MLHFERSREFHDVERPCEIGVDVRAWIFEAVAQSGMGSEMDDHMWQCLACGLPQGIHIFEHEVVRTKSR